MVLIRFKSIKSQNDTGASLVEYSLLVALIAVTAIASVQALAQGVQSSIADSRSEIERIDIGSSQACVGGPLVCGG